MTETNSCMLYMSLCLYIYMKYKLHIDTYVFFTELASGVMYRDRKHDFLIF